MSLNFIGLGLSDEKDITLRGLEAAKSCDFLYLENYTSILQCSATKLEKLFGKKIILADRNLVEESDEILENAKTKKVGFLIVGDPFSATTHIDLLLRAKKLKIETTIIHNSSILTAIGVTGLFLYKFGRVTTIPFENLQIKSPYEVLQKNLKNDLHTLFLLDLDPSIKRYLTIKEAIEYLLKNGMKKDQLCVGCARLGSTNQTIKAGKTKDLLKENFGKLPYCLIVPAKLNFKEEEALNNFMI